MKKIFINELETEKRNELIKKNSKLINKLQAYLYNSNMEMQYIDSKNIMNDDALRSIEYHNDYSSFFYTLKDWRKFIINIEPDYLSEEARKTADIIYKKIDVLDSMDPYSDNYYIEEREDGTSDNVIRLDIAYTDCFI